MLRESTAELSLQMTPIREEDALPVHPQPEDPPSSLQSPEPGLDVTRDEFLYYGVTLYRAALQGDWETMRSIWIKSPTWMCKRITKGGETVLHIAAAAKHSCIVEELVSILGTNSLAITNKVGNTALCFAAVSGVVEIARAMVEKNKALPNIRGSQGMTPLHMAVLLGHRKMVWYLLEVTDDEQLTDQDRIELLTSSIDTDLFEVALHILHKHRKLAILRDAKKETALHALARKPLKHDRIQPSMSLRSKLQYLLAGRDITQHKSEEPQVALELVQCLWNEIIKEEENISKLLCYPWRLLFVAAKLGKVEFLTVLIRSYPDLIWKVDENRRSIFHIAVIHRHEEIFKLIYEIGAIKDLIATYTDDHGNNMLHMASKLPPPDRVNCVSGAALQMQREILWFEAVKKMVRPEYTETENKDGKTPQALFSEEHEGLRTKGEEWMKKTAESCALVVTIIATVVFSAAFQLPGGADDKGNPVLVNKASFVVFALSNAISLFTSTASILMFLSILTSRYAERDFLISLPRKLMMGLIWLLVSIATMIVAFTVTFFITFQKGVTWAPIPIALIATIPVTLFALQQFPLLVDIYHSTYGSHSIFEPNKSKLFQLSSHHHFPPKGYGPLDAPNFAPKTPSYYPPSSNVPCTYHPEAYTTLTMSTHPSVHRVITSDPAPIMSRHRSSHRQTASQIVDLTASEQSTPTFPDIEIETLPERRRRTS